MVRRAFLFANFAAYMKETIEVKREGRTPSRVVVGNVLGDLGEYLPGRRIIVITDSNVHRRHMGLIDRYEKIIIGLGETNKTLLTIDRIYRELIEMNVDRECFILGFGGGIVTDVAGFAASTYMRGVPFGFIASTLLAQVDASVGGKNGVNVEGYKNMVGTFNQPDFVLCDTSLLKTLPEREFRAGLAEVIKAGIIADPVLFDLLEGSSFEGLFSDQKLLKQAVTAAVKVKASIVEQDERESGERRKLNLGHTFAHAIEKTTQNYNHGEAVAIGLSMICDAAVSMGVFAATDAARVKRVLAAMGLPTGSEIDPKRLFKALRLDKKRDSESIHIVLPTEIGKCEVRKISFDELEGYVR